MPYVAPFRLPDGQPFLPEGEFLVPLCTTRERLTKMLTVLTYGGLLYGQPGASDYDHVIDLMRALGWVDDPCAADCFPCADKCVEYPPFSPIISYFPNDPYRTPNLVPDGYFTPPWYTNPTVPQPGVQPNDAMVNLLSIPNVYAAIVTGFPRARITFSGTGELEIEFVKVIQGGYALVTKDGSFVGAQVINCASLGIADIASIELILELLGLDTDADPTQTEVLELKFTSPGEHFVDITFLPALDFDNNVLGFGGGLRRVSLCGLSTMAYFRLRQNPEDPCLMEQQLQPNGAWLAAFDYGLCNSTFGELIRLQNQQTTIINRQYTTTYDGTPGSINPSAPSTSFSDSSTRETALCMAAIRYVSQRMSDAWYQARAQLLLLAALYSNPLTRTLDKLVGGISILPDGLSAEAVIQAAENASAIQEAACGLADALKGDAISEAAFFAGIDTLSGTGNVGTIYTILKASRGRSNYLYFLDLLGAAWDLVQAGVDDCPCEEGEWCYTFDFTQSAHGWVNAATALNRPYGTHVPGTGWVQTSYPDAPGERAVGIVLDIPDTGCTITTMTLFMVEPQFKSSAVSVEPNVIALGYPPSLASRFRIVQWPQPQANYLELNFTNPTHIVIDLYNETGHVSDGILTRATIYGTGTNPFGSNNCA